MTLRDRIAHRIVDEADELGRVVHWKDAEAYADAALAEVEPTPLRWCVNGCDKEA